MNRFVCAALVLVVSSCSKRQAHAIVADAGPSSPDLQTAISDAGLPEAPAEAAAQRDEPDADAHRGDGGNGEMGAGFTTDGMEALDSVQRDEIVALLEAGRVPHGPLLGKPWPRREKTYLVAALDAASSDEGLRFHVVAFDLAGQSVRRLASEGPFWLAKDEKLREFDFAAFRLTTKEFAFGLRYSRERSYAGGGFAKLEGVVFFRLDGEQIDQILGTSTSYEADLAGEWNEDGTRNRDGHAGRAVIIVRKHKTRGHFDWVKRAEDGRAATLVWDGDRYVMNGPDPLETERLDIFDSE